MVGTPVVRRRGACGSILSLLWVLWVGTNSARGTLSLSFQAVSSPAQRHRAVLSSSRTRRAAARGVGGRVASALAGARRRGSSVSVGRRVVRNGAGGGLSMHMGHSHGHHTHDHGHGRGNDDGELQRQPLPPGWRGNVLRLSRRPTARVLFAALAVLLPALVRRRFRSIGRADVAAFVATAAVLTFFDGVRGEVKRVIRSWKGLGESLRKHSTPLSTNFFFRNKNAADRVTLVGVVINLVLSVGKAIVGVTCHSSALVADAGHSLSDLFSDFITLWAVQIGRLPPDDDHPYGHGKFEAVGALFLALTLLGTGLSVGSVSYKTLFEIISVQRASGTAAAAALVDIPTFPALIMAALSITSKEWLYRITRRVGEAIHSPVVIANAWHHRSDAYSSILALISIGLAMSVPTLLAADSAAGLLVAGMICMTGAEIMGDAVKQLTDTSDEALVGKVEEIAAATEDVTDVKRVRARQVGSSALVDVSVTTPDGLSSSATRAVEERLRWRVLDGVPGVLDVDVHATGSAVVCPLLASAAATAQAGEDGAPVASRSAADIEDDARGVLEGHPAVRSVHGVTVHYQDTLLINVDANIRVDPDTTVAGANRLAGDLRQLLEDTDTIHKANIFLDLNEGAMVAS